MPGTTPHKLDDHRISGINPLISPSLLRYELPADDSVAATVTRGREGVVDILHGPDDRLLVVVGPCSIHDPAAALDYAQRLADARRGRTPATCCDRDARLLREAAHHGGLEGPDQRPAAWTAASRSTTACGWRAGCCST